MTINELYENGFSVENAYRSYCTIIDPNVWRDFFVLCDRYIRQVYSNRIVLFNYEPVLTFETTVAAWIDSNSYMIAKLADSEKLEYNPINNYDSKITETITVRNENNTSHEEHGETGGTVSRKITGKNVNKKDYQETENLSTAYGDKTATDILSVAPYNSGLAEKEKKFTNEGSHTDTSTNGKNGNDTLTQNVDQSDNTTTNDLSSNTGSITRDGFQTTERSFSQSGNIGVTTSQQMIESERHVANFSAVTIISAKIVNLITYAIWGGIS